MHMERNDCGAPSETHLPLRRGETFKNHIYLLTFLIQFNSTHTKPYLLSVFAVG